MRFPSVAKGTGAQVDMHHDLEWMLWSTSKIAIICFAEHVVFLVSRT